MTDTANLGLPCIEGSQAQKHVTHNDALRILDTLVQLSALDRDLTTPPASPSEGQRWIVKTGAGDAWSGHDNAIAAWQDGGWQFSAPQTGWVAYVVDEGTSLVWNGSAWDDFFATVTSLQNLAMLGLGSTADATNPLSAKLNNALFVARTVAEGGDGDLRYKLSKEAAANTLSFLFQDNFSGRAEIGLTGDDDFHFKVSPDGSAWYDSLVIDRNSGNIEVQGQARFDSRVGIGQPPLADGGIWFARDPDNPYLLFSASASGSVTHIGQFRANLAASIIGITDSGGGTYHVACDVSNHRVGIMTDTPSNALSVEGVAAPESDNSYTLGTSDKRWSTVYAATGTINTSDARAKTDIAPSDLGLDFVLALKPARYRWAEGGLTAEKRTVSEEIEEPVTEQVAQNVGGVETVDGRPVWRKKTVTVEQPVFDYLPLVDEAGKPVLDEQGRQRRHAVPRTRKVGRSREVTTMVPRAGKRQHYGLIAQDVKEALTAAGVADFAGWILTDPNDPQSTQGLRYDQFIAPLIKAVQEQQRMIKDLQNKIAGHATA